MGIGDDAQVVRNGMLHKKFCHVSHIHWLQSETSILESRPNIFPCQLLYSQSARLRSCKIAQALPVKQSKAFEMLAAEARQGFEASKAFEMLICNSHPSSPTPQRIIKIAEEVGHYLCLFLFQIVDVQVQIQSVAGRGLTLSRTAGSAEGKSMGGYELLLGGINASCQLTKKRSPSRSEPEISFGTGLCPC